jgi:hypothetical protein
MVDPLFLGIRLEPAFSGDEHPGTKPPRDKKILWGLTGSFFDNSIDTLNTTENECQV